MKSLIRFAILFFVFLFAQVFLARNLDFGYGMQLFLLPLFIMLLPFDTGVFMLMLLGFILGILADSLMNSYGLNASSLVLFAYLRPAVFTLFLPKEGYDNLKDPTLSDMGWRWFLLTYGLLLSIYLSWFFFLEVFRISEWFLLLRNTFMSFVVSFLVALVSQLFFRKRLVS
ncbi:MAG: hypothetical protein EBR54_00740 [Flavobacteriia bacterium]|nr:hypothetical protein [Flavobacteriia bacterium]